MSYSEKVFLLDITGNMIERHESDYDYSLRLATGRVITLDKITQSRTYAGLLMGTPDKKMNDRLIEEALERAGKSPHEEQQPEPSGFLSKFLGRRNARNAPSKKSMPPEPVCLVAPERRDYLEQPGDMQHVLDRQKDHPPELIHRPEWLPEIECAGLFRSFEPTRNSSRDMSLLTIIWYQETFGLVRADLEKLRDVDWDRFAADGDY